MNAQIPLTMEARAQAALDAFAADLAAMIAARPPEAIRRELTAGCWIYGAGEYGQQLRGALTAGGYPVLGFIDRRGGPGFDSLMDLPVRHPDEITGDLAQGRTLVAAVLNPTSGPDSVLPFASSLPFAAIAMGADLPDALGDVAKTFWQGSRAYFLAHIEELKAVCGRLADQQSLDTVLGILRYRVTGQKAVHPVFDEEMYLPREFPLFDGPITFVDGGAFIGDTCAYVMDRGVEIGRYIAFEPDDTNLKRLIAFADKAAIGEATIVPCGLADRLVDLSFAGAKGPSSRITADSPAAAVSTTTIRCVALDDMLPGVRPDFIKLDIEGAEIAALNGMSKTLERARPRLAICLYHRPQDIWEIPEFVSRIYDKLYIRQHGECGWDTVLYAFP